MRRAGHLFNSQDKENFAIIEKLIRKHFSLSNDSLEYFAEELKNPCLDDTFYEAFSKFGSSRISLPIPIEIQETLDSGWNEHFKRNFKFFIEECGITYKNYKENKIEIDKNTLKLKKALLKFYKEYFEKDCDRIIEEVKKETPSVEGVSFDLSTLEKDAVDLLYKRVVREKVCKMEFLSFYRASGVNLLLPSIETHIFQNVLDCESTLEENDLAKKRFAKERLMEDIEKWIDGVWDSVSENKISKDDLRIVLSFNFADWFLCSTGESWTSCLSLGGSSANFWYGLPGLVGDKNRIMIYLTRGKEKSYEGIKTENFLYRTWALLGEDDGLNIVRWFPNSSIGSYEIHNFIEEKTGIKINEESFSDYEDFCSKHKLNFIYNVDGKAILPYFDHSSVGKSFHIESGCGGIYTKDINSDYVNECEVYSGDSFNSLRELIQENIDMASASENTLVCESCSERMTEFEGIRTPDDEMLCERCFHDRYFCCDSCSDSVLLENSHEVFNRLLCENCFDDDFYYCHNCNNVCEKEEVFEAENELFCESCFHKNYFYCDFTDQAHRLDFAVTVAADDNGRNTILAAFHAVSERGYILNTEDEIWYKKECMVKQKDGTYIHMNDCQMSLEFGVAV